MDDPVTRVDALLRRHASAQPDRQAVRDGERQVTWAELDTRVEEVAAGLRRLGVVGGQRVAFALGNSLELVVTYLAASRNGQVAVPVNPASTSGELSRVLEHSGAKVLVAGAESLPASREALRTLSAEAGAPAPVLVAVGGEGEPGEVRYDDLPTPGGSAQVSPQDPEGLAVLLYTSGTSGRPRAAMLSHRALLANVRQNASTEPPPVLPDDVVLGVLPMFHVYGLNAVLGQVLLTGATLVVGRRLDPAETLRLVEEESVTCLPVAPPLLAAWLRDPPPPESLASVRLLVSGAAPLAAETVRACEAALGKVVDQGYGLTEAGPVVASTIGVSPRKPGSVGRPLPGVEVRVVDETGEDADPVDPGEIWVRGDNLFSGYWPGREGAPGPGGWLHTGDLGYLDADGDLHLVDRIKDLVIVSGFNVYPSEIEDVIMEVSGVAECAVVGAPAEDAGEQVLAYVVPADDSSAAGTAELRDAVARHCARRLARFKVPATVEVVSDIPHSLVGKVAKGRLRLRQARADMGLG